ncbi:MAG: hypothetical protein LBD58_08950 [Treponema sp.]|nr:hypothetical protein [Treponema sp.]
MLKEIKTGGVIIMYRASSHTYSPDFNSIEKDWANMKRDGMPPLFVIHFRLRFMIIGVSWF